MAVYHPTHNSCFTDYFGMSISPGDRIIYPSVAGGGAAELTEALIVKIVALIAIPGHWIPTGRYSVTPHIREDHQHKAYPTEYLPHGERQNRQFNIDYSKAYILVVRPKNYWGNEPDGYSSRKSTIKNVWNVVRAPR